MAGSSSLIAKHGVATQASRGFTMIEVLFALAFFLIGLYGIVGLQIAIFSGARKSTDVALASSLVSGIIEELHVSDIEGLEDDGNTSRYFNQYGLEVSADADPLYAITWEATIPSVTFYEVTVTATWLNPGEAARVTDAWPGHQVRMKTNIMRKYTAD